MKNGFLTYQVGNNSDIRYAHPLGTWVSLMIEGIQTFDFDNLSESFLIDYIIRELKSMNNLVVFILVHDQNQTGPIIRILSNLERKTDRILIIQEGENELIKKKCKILAKDNFFIDIKYEEQQNIILNFFKK